MMFRKRLLENINVTYNFVNVKTPGRIFYLKKSVTSIREASVMHQLPAVQQGSVPKLIPSLTNKNAGSTVGVNVYFLGAAL
ncbi:hypothetical protein [Paenibacillus sp. PK3_47]|uniref:hypothetical protein n=1 Tax=Paenibacillus sp. PK3_47 TaxID=2072642 RepID=UPI00201E654E|nr:hypothetical protein [Paenibacillus sp. PK3_47]